MKVTVDFRKTGLEIELPDGTEVLAAPEAPGLPDPVESIREKLRSPVGCPPLTELAKSRSSACVVVSDITRPVPNAVILPPLLSELESAGVPRDRITILVATGLHRPNQGEELVRMVGEEVAGRYRIENHFARKPETLTDLGTTDAGTPVLINSLYYQSDLKIVTGLIEPHIFAGFSGGRKAVCPGVAGIDTIRIMHGPELLADPKSAEGVVAGNLYTREADRVVAKAGCDFMLNVVLNGSRRITGVFAGELARAHSQGVEFARQKLLAVAEEPFDIAVTTAAGYPLDTTFYQSVKGMTAAMPAVRKDGVILLLAGCDEGVGKDEFTDQVTSFDDPDDFIRRIFEPDYFQVDQWQVQEFCKALKHARIIVYGPGIEPEYRDKLPLEVVDSVEQGLQAARGHLGAAPRMCVIPRGPYTLIGGPGAQF